jgi:hypothetical protein
MKVGLPRTRLGWIRLLKIAVHRCWECNGPTYLDPWRLVGGSKYRVCLKCGGIEYPVGILQAMRLQRRDLDSAGEEG